MNWEACKQKWFGGEIEKKRVCVIDYVGRVRVSATRGSNSPTLRRQLAGALLMRHQASP